MTRIAFILTLTLLVSFATKAQTNQEGRIEAEKIAFFTKRLNLTPDEARVFWPVYNDYISRRNKINQDKNALTRYVNQNFKNLSDKELIESSDRIVNFMLESAQLAKTYHEQFKTILPPEKVIRIYQTEAQFKNILLNQLQNRRSQQQPTRRRQQF